ncbi:hypothetical protein [Oryzibacter oryziterrae]|uniref:hypothetical protein n=1 Tax=Oryzibacter oryziterrae TaxID=2766474 RepID=UPI001F491274|nr:hypothetical protein [Oryzibacter oryziterrae]
MDLLIGLGNSARFGIMYVARLLTQEYVPGLVAVGLGSLLLLAMVLFSLEAWRRRSALQWLHDQIVGAGGAAELKERVEDIKERADRRSGGAARSVAFAWSEYRETFVDHDENGVAVLRNAVRPGAFFNLDDLRFGPGFWRVVPGLFVTAGLFLTFLGLISALASMDLTTPDKITESLKTLLTIASAKFIMSLTGLFCSIFFTIVLRVGLGRVDAAIHRLCGAIEDRLSYISLEALAVEQLRTIREQRDNFRQLGMDMVAELGRPLREELPLAISNSIQTAMGPLFQQVSQLGTDNMGSMVKDLSARFSDDVGRALSQASERLMVAGDRIAQLSERMDSSSGRMGSEMDAAVTRLAQAVDDLRSSMGATAETASGALNAGADRILSVMSETLEGIRSNTAQGANSMQEAAQEMRAAAEGFRKEIETAASTGREAARGQMEEASRQASEAIGGAAQSLLSSFGATSAEIARLAGELTAKSTQDLLMPLDRASEKFRGLVASLADGTTSMNRLADGVKTAADSVERASGQLRQSSQDLVNATSPVRGSVEAIENSMRLLGQSTEAASSVVVRSAEQTARSAADALASAVEVLGGQRNAIETALNHSLAILDRLKGQGERFDEIDEKLGVAFDTYTTRVDTAVRMLFDHVKKMQDELAPALGTLRTVVESAEQFIPQSGRR